MKNVNLIDKKCPIKYGLIEVRKKTITEYHNKIKRHNETEPGTNVPGSATLWLFFYSPFVPASQLILLTYEGGGSNRQKK